ncbi:DUF6082 family protein [Sphaerisporangium sp. NPDC051011]|uniref:DUF6082 family protein n=1 Tax=Sphaerisporangium sp. NPDC051011 TaxID=3155792 RepID=UPI0033F0E1E9
MKEAGRANRLLLALVLLLFVLAAVGLIGVSPIALGLFQGSTARWERLSFIGQTYGAASAILSVLALIGVVAALTFQARETKLGREEARRQAIGDLLKMAMEDPDLDECWGPVPPPADLRTRKQQLYTNMIIAEWAMSFELKTLREPRLRLIANEMFQGRPGRLYWQAAREARLTTSGNRAERRFHEILDEEYRRAEPSYAEGSLPVGPMNAVGRRSGRRRVLLASATAGAAAVAFRFLHTMRRKSAFTAADKFRKL